MKTWHELCTIDSTLNPGLDSLLWLGPLGVALISWGATWKVRMRWEGPDAQSTPLPLDEALRAAVERVLNIRAGSTAELERYTEAAKRAQEELCQTLDTPPRQT